MIVNWIFNILWGVLLSALFAALRALHRLRTAPALLAFTVGVLAHVAFLIFFYAPLIGSVYRAFGLPGPG